MSKYIKIGFFYEEKEEDQQKHLSTLRNDKPHPKETQILQYLASGVDAGVSMMLEHDYLTTPPKLLGETTLQSDGVWIWPTSLAYYVKEYHITLPDEFVTKMEQQKWCVSPNTEFIPDVPDGHITM